MSLDPSPLSPAPTPLLRPTDPSPSRGSALVGTLIAVILAVVVAGVSLRYGDQVLFGPAGVRAVARGVPATSPFTIQGFDDYWRRAYQTGNAPSYDSPNNQNVMQSEAQQYHMNVVVITITVDQNLPNDTFLIGYGTAANIDSYPDAVYVNLAKQAYAVGLTPVFKLAVRVLQGPQKDPWSGNIGSQWNGIGSNAATIGGTVGSREHAWFDSYSGVAAHYAGLAQSLHMPFFIFGSNLLQMTGDTADTQAPKDPGARPGPGDTGACTGRRDCEWRHVIGALRNPTYTTYAGRPAQGAAYTGKLIYAATNRTIGSGFEWENITWWNATDIIGVDAFFPLTNGRALDTTSLMRAWHGKGDLAVPADGDLFARLKTVSAAANRPLLFTDAGYESVPSSNKQPGQAYVSGTVDQQEQLHDMQALLYTFSGQPWWIGVIWYGEYPVWPRSALVTYNLAAIDPTLSTDDWQYNTNWAGDCLVTATCTHPEKAAGQWLRGYYTPQPIPANP